MKAPWAGTCSVPRAPDRNQTRAKPTAQDPGVEEQLATGAGQGMAMASRVATSGQAGRAGRCGLRAVRCRGGTLQGRSGGGTGLGSQAGHEVGHDPVDREVAGVDHDGVVGLGEGARLAPLVDRVAPGDVGGHRLVVEVGHLLGTTAGPNLGRCREVHLEVGVGEDDGADVAALQHPAPRVRAHSRWRRTSSSRTAGLAATTLTARVTSGPRISMVASTPSTGLVRPASTVRSTLRARLATTSVSAGSIPHRGARERDAPVHGSGVQVLQTEVVGEGPAHGGLAGTGGAVDGHDPQGGVGGILGSRVGQARPETLPRSCQ